MGESTARLAINLQFAPDGPGPSGWAEAHRYEDVDGEHCEQAMADIDDPDWETNKRQIKVSAEAGFLRRDLGAAGKGRCTQLIIISTSGMTVPATLLPPCPLFCPSVEVSFGEGD